MSSKLRAIKRGQQKKDKVVLAIVDGSNTFGPTHCEFVQKSVAEENGYPYVEGNSPRQLYDNMMKMAEKTQVKKSKEELIEEHKELNEEFKSRYGKDDVVCIARRMCDIEDELLEVYGYKMFED